MLEQDVNNNESLIISAKLTSLFRNLKSIEEETGLYDLYIEYPFLSDKMLDGTYIRAPLFLHPVELIRNKKHGIQWELAYDTDSESMLNRSLFLAIQKMSNLHVRGNL
ncbi:DUF4011 domain-containing protein [Lentibacillus sp. L22]|uniref:DUF4011 domain-containing protein n=1 Tax=Lentibacillus TaxID=175304 RepID=UPI0022B200A3|nr:DUF4011 domain-containing protein [Lentibacillus daqui]